MDMETEINSLRVIVDQQSVQISAFGTAMFSMFDLLGHVLQTRDVADRSEIAGRLQEIIDREKLTASTEVEMMRLAFLEALVGRLQSPASTPPIPAPGLRVVNGGK
jgi:hypothetical protein